MKNLAISDRKITLNEIKKFKQPALVGGTATIIENSNTTIVFSIDDLAK